MMKVAQEYNCEFLSHGCTGKGNDQVRFELAWKALDQSTKTIIPWRIPEFCERFASVPLLPHQTPTVRRY
jgi:argininosuccinate synthase